MTGRRLTSLLSALLAAAALLAPATSAADAQNRVRAFSLAAHTHAQGQAKQSPCTQPGSSARSVRTASGSCVAAKEAPAIVRGGETAAARYGREIHKSFDYGPGFEREFRLPSGRRADAVNFETREIVELKPNNPRAIAQGQRQLDRYAEEFNREFPGDPFTTRLHTYDRP